MLSVLDLNNAMFKIIIIMAAGMSAGYFLRNQKKIIRLTDPIITIAIYMLLFFLGISIGTNKTILENIGTIGLQSLFLSIGAVGGSVAFSYLTYIVYFRNNEK